MEWVETIGPTVGAALDAALDELGVDVDEVEYEVLEEPKSGLFGRIGAHPARVRARVKPISREKPGERQRMRARQERRAASEGHQSDVVAPDGRAATGRAADGEEASGSGDAEPAAAGGETRKARRRRRRRRRGGDRAQEGATVEVEDVPVGAQADVADEFVRGLLTAFAVEAEVAVRIEGDVVFVDVEGDDLGLLVGPRGATLRAIEELVRTVVQRRTDVHGARVHVDVGGYQAKRRAALERFATELAARVRESGRELALEPMAPADRKVVHDAVARIEGVVTVSEGEEPRRRVVLRPG